MVPLVNADDLAGFPGAPFSQEVVTAAGETVRRECGWHIAPEITETVTLDCAGGPVLFLPTLRLVEVSEVRDAVTGRVLSGWRLSKAGMLSRGAGWPAGFGAVEVDLVHGFEECPAELLPIVARGAQRRVSQESLGSRSVTYERDPGAPAVLAAFKIPGRP